MQIKELLKRIRRAKKEGIITDDSEVVVGIPTEIYKAKDGVERRQHVPGTIIAVSVEGACDNDFDGDIPNTFEIIPSVEEVRDIYIEQCLLCDSP